MSNFFETYSDINLGQTTFITSGSAGNRRYTPVVVKARILPAAMHPTNPRLEAEIEKLLK
jgi:hypothetical protein